MTQPPLSKKVSRRAQALVSMSDRQRWTILGLVAAIGTSVAIVAILTGAPNQYDVVAVFLGYLVLLSLPFLVRAQEIAWFHPLIFFIVWWLLLRGVLPAIGVYATGLEHHEALVGWTRYELREVVISATLLDVLALVATYLGYYGTGRLKTVRIRFSPPRRILPKVLMVAAVSLGAFLMLVSLAGGLENLLLQRGLPEPLRIQAETGGAHWHFLVGLLIPACLVWLALKPEAWHQIRFWVLFLLGLTLGFAATGSRSGVIVPVLIALAIWMVQHQRVPYTRALVIAAAGVFIVGVLGNFRLETRGVRTIEQVRLELSPTVGIERGIETITYNASAKSGLYGIVGKVPDQVPLLMGQSYLSIPAAPIPRMWWSNKPEAGGKLTSTYIFGNPLSGVPPHGTGEAFWNFHVPGVIAVFILWGVFLKWLTNVYQRNDREPSAKVWLLLTLFYLQPHSPSFYDWLQAIVPAVLFVMLFSGTPRFEP